MSREGPGIETLLRHGTLLTMDAERRIVIDGAIAVAGGRIVAVGRDRDLAAACEAVQMRDLEGAVVHPGLVDAHVHTGMDLLRGLVPESSPDWTEVEAPFLRERSREDDYLSTLLCCMEMVANGSTLYSDTGSSVDLEATVQATELVGVRGMPGHFVADRAGEIDFWHAPTERCLDTLREQCERYPFRDGGKVRCAIGLGGMETVSDRLLVEAKRLADETGRPTIMHQSWDEAEVHEAIEVHGRRPVEHLADLGILGPGLTLVHMIHLNDAEVDLIAETGTRIVHCPSASLRRAKGAFRVGRMIEMLERGVTVGLGSDGHSGKHDVARQMYLAATVHREVRGCLPALSAPTAFEMATLHGARALAMAEEVGSLESGKRADLVIHGLDRIESRPRFRDPVVNLVYHALSATVRSVMVEGEFIYDHGKFTRFDEAEVLREIDARARRIEARYGVRARDAWPLVE